MDAEHLLDHSWQRLFDDGLFPPRPDAAEVAPYALMPVGFGPHADWVAAPVAPLWQALARRGMPPEQVAVQGEDLLLRWPGYEAGTVVWEQLLLAGPMPPELTLVISTAGCTLILTAPECLALARHLR